MPQNKSSSPPGVMTWRKATPVLLVAAFFDLLRLAFTWFVFVGPALAAAACTVAAGSFLEKYTFGVLGTGTAAAACSITAGAVGIAGLEITAPFGLIMADAVGFIGFLVLGFWLFMANRRIFAANAFGALWFIGGFAVGEIPFIGSLPVFSLALWRLYRTQIKVEKVAHAAWKSAQAEALAREQREREMLLAEAQERQEAADAEAAELEAANDDQNRLVA